MKLTITRVFYLLCILLIFGMSSCEKELYEDGITNNKEFKMRRITLEELKNIPNAFKKFRSIDNLQKNKSKSKLIYDSINDFTIDTDKIVMCEKDGQYTLTFPISRSYETDKVENLVLQSAEDNTYIPFIFKYDLTENEKTDVINGNSIVGIENKMTSKYLSDLDIDEFGNSSERTTICILVTVAICTEGNHEGGQTNNGSPCPAHGTEQMVFCWDYVGPGGDTGDDGWTGNEGNNTEGNNTNPSNPYTPSGGGNGGGPKPNTPQIPIPPVIVTMPLLEAEDVIEQETPCDELRKFIANNSIQQSLGILKPQSSGPIERGNYISETTNASGASVLSFPVIPPKPNDPTRLNFDAGITAGNVIGLMHCHTDPASTGGVAMFGPGDILSLFKIARYYSPTNGQTVNYAEFTVMLSVGSGHYALKIKDFSTFYTNLQANYDNFKKELEEEYKESTITATSTTLLKNFLNILKDNNLSNNVSLYKATESTIAGISKITGWKEQILKADGTNDELPCNK